MVVDTSAMVAIALREPGFEDLIERIGDAEIVAMAAPALLECAIVLSSRLKQDSRLIVSGLLRSMHAQIIDLTLEHYEVAMEAFLRFGRGRHAAALNFGDCISYAVATVSGLPLLFTGTDFSRTDINAA